MQGAQNRFASSPVQTEGNAEPVPMSPPPPPVQRACTGEKTPMLSSSEELKKAFREHAVHFFKFVQRMQEDCLKAGIEPIRLRRYYLKDKNNSVHKILKTVEQLQYEDEGGGSWHDIWEVEGSPSDQEREPEMEVKQRGSYRPEMSLLSFHPALLASPELLTNTHHHNSGPNLGMLGRRGGFFRISNVPDPVVPLSEKPKKGIYSSLQATVPKARVQAKIAAPTPQQVYLPPLRREQSPLGTKRCLDRRKNAEATTGRRLPHRFAVPASPSCLELSSQLSPIRGEVSKYIRSPAVKRPKSVNGRVNHELFPQQSRSTAPPSPERISSPIRHNGCAQTVEGNCQDEQTFLHLIQPPPVFQPKNIKSPKRSQALSWEEAESQIQGCTDGCHEGPPPPVYFNQREPSVIHDKSPSSASHCVRKQNTASPLERRPEPPCKSICKPFAIDLDSETDSQVSIETFEKTLENTLIDKICPLSAGSITTPPTALPDSSPYADTTPGHSPGQTDNHRATSPWPWHADLSSPSVHTSAWLSSPAAPITTSLGFGLRALSPTGGKITSSNTNVREPIHLEQVTMSPALSTGLWSRIGANSHVRTSSSSSGRSTGDGAVPTNMKNGVGELNLSGVDGQTTTEIGSSSRKSVQNNCQRSPAAARTLTPPPGVEERATTAVRSSNRCLARSIPGSGVSRASDGVCGLAGAKYGKGIAARATIPRAPSRLIGVSRSATISPGPGIASIEKMYAHSNQSLEGNQASRQSSCPFWKQMPTAVAEVVIAGLVCAEPCGPCVPHTAQCSPTLVNIHR